MLDQIEPVFMEVANGAVEFVPKPADTKALIAAHYSVPRTLLIRFRDDSIDETNEVEAALVGGDTHSADSGDSPESSSDNSHSLDVTVLDLAGDHVRPLVPEPPELPPDVATSINEAGDAIASIADAFGIREDSTDVVANPLGFLRAGFEQARAEVGKAVGGVSEGERRVDTPRRGQRLMSWRVRLRAGCSRRRSRRMTWSVRVACGRGLAWIPPRDARVRLRRGSTLGGRAFD